MSSAVYWKNGILDTLSSMSNSVANAITASGNDIYIAGNAGTNGSQAVYWKNGIQTSLENVLSASANAITVSDTDVYVAGYIVPSATCNVRSLLEER